MKESILTKNMEIAIVRETDSQAVAMPIEVTDEFISGVMMSLENKYLREAVEGGIKLAKKFWTEWSDQPFQWNNELHEPYIALCEQELRRWAVNCPVHEPGYVNVGWLDIR